MRVVEGLRKWNVHRRARSYERKYSDPGYRQHDDGSFSGPYKGMVFGRGKAPTRPPRPAHPKPDEVQS